MKGAHYRGEGSGYRNRAAYTHVIPVSPVKSTFVVTRGTTASSRSYAPGTLTNAQAKEANASTSEER